MIPRQNFFMKVKKSVILLIVINYSIFEALLKSAVVLLIIFKSEQKNVKGSLVFKSWRCVNKHTTITKKKSKRVIQSGELI